MTTKIEKNLTACGWTDCGITYKHASGRGAVDVTPGGRFVAKLDGEVLVGESGKPRYFGTLQAAVLALEPALPVVEAPEPTEPQPPVEPTVENKIDSPPAIESPVKRSESVPESSKVVSRIRERKPPQPQVRREPVAEEIEFGRIEYVPGVAGAGRYVAYCKDGQPIIGSNGGPKHFVMREKAVDALSRMSKKAA